MSVVIGTPAGRPSSVATSAGPWDSPAVSQRNLLNGAPQCSRPVYCPAHARARVLWRGRGARVPGPPPPILPRPGRVPGRRSIRRTPASAVLRVPLRGVGAEEVRPAPLRGRRGLHVLRGVGAEVVGAPA